MILVLLDINASNKVIFIDKTDPVWWPKEVR